MTTNPESSSMKNIFWSKLHSRPSFKIVPGFYHHQSHSLRSRYRIWPNFAISRSCQQGCQHGATKKCQSQSKNMPKNAKCQGKMPNKMPKIKLVERPFSKTNDSPVGKGENCAFRDKSMKLAGDMSFYVFFHIRVGATLGHDANPPFWGVKAPHF